MSGFWGEACPARNASDLLHQHAADCRDHWIDQCCECGARATEWKPTDQAVPAPLNVQERLRSLGLVDGEGRPTVRSSEEIEEKYATGEPVGPAWGRGRSWSSKEHLGPRDRYRLLFVAARERMRGYR